VKLTAVLSARTVAAAEQLLRDVPYFVLVADTTRQDCLFKIWSPTHLFPVGNRSGRSLDRPAMSGLP
jgi:hypothetical protein